MSKATDKQARIHKILDDAEALLKKENVKFFMGVLDKNPKAKDGGKAYSVSDIDGSDMTQIMDLAFPTQQDTVILATHVGQLIMARRSALKNQTLKGNDNI